MPDEFPPTPDRRSEDVRPSADGPSDDCALPADASATADTEGPSRRSFLSGTGSVAASLAATAGLGATAGCVELLPSLAQATRYEPVDMPPAGAPEYRQWVPASDAEYLSDGIGTVTTPSNDGQAVLGFPFQYGIGWIVHQIDYFGVGIEHYDLAFTVHGERHGVAVLEGPVAPDEVAETVLGSGYEAAGTIEHPDAPTPYDRFVREDQPRTVAVTDGRILFGTGDVASEAIRYALDTYHGRVPRATDDPAFRRVTDEVGLRPFLFSGPDFERYAEKPIDRQLVCMDFDDAGGLLTAGYAVFENGAPDRETLRDVASKEMGRNPESTEILRDGDFAGFEVRLSEDAAGSSFADVPVPPQITWGLDRPDGAIELRHEAGESVPAADLYVSVGRENGDPVLADVQFADRYETVGPGDSLRVPTASIPEDEFLSVWFTTENAEMVLVDVDP